jgi:hypothetical protein
MTNAPQHSPGEDLPDWLRPPESRSHRRTLIIAAALTMLLLLSGLIRSFFGDLPEVDRAIAQRFAGTEVEGSNTFLMAADAEPGTGVPNGNSCGCPDRKEIRRLRQ